MRILILTLTIVALTLLAGCASMEEAYLLDREFGKAQMAAWEQQIAHPNNPYAVQAPEGIEGITAEEVMGVYNGTFAEKPEKSDVFELGISDNN